MQKLFSFFKTSFCVLTILVIVVPRSVNAQAQQRQLPQEEVLETIVTDVQEEKEVEIGSSKQLYQKLEVFVTGEKRKGQKLIIESGTIPVANVQKYKIGDKLLVTAIDSQGEEQLYISDYIRRTPLYWLFGLFVVLTVLIGRKRGIASLIGMGLSFWVIFQFVLPQILAGKDPVTIAIIGSIFIIPITFYLSHGLNKKTTSAILGTIITLIITGILANIFVDVSRLTGFASEEAGFLQAAKPDLINIKGLLLAGIIIGVLGILDDITISQSAIVYQLKKSSPTISFNNLFNQTMDVGRDHIASVVNTLILVYTGAAMPLLLLFINSPHPYTEIINYEIVAEEIVRTLVASIGLILAVPITTLITSLLAKND